MISCELVLTSDNPVIYPFEENLNKGTVLQNDQALVFLEKLRYADRLCEEINVNHFVSFQLAIERQIFDFMCYLGSGDFYSAEFSPKIKAGFTKKLNSDYTAFNETELFNLLENEHFNFDNKRLMLKPYGFFKLDCSNYSISEKQFDKVFERLNIALNDIYCSLLIKGSKSALFCSLPDYFERGILFSVIKDHFGLDIPLFRNLKIYNDFYNLINNKPQVLNSIYSTRNYELQVQTQVDKAKDMAFNHKKLFFPNSR